MPLVRIRIRHAEAIYAYLLVLYYISRYIVEGGKLSLEPLSRYKYNQELHNQSWATGPRLPTCLPTLHGILLGMYLVKYLYGAYGAHDFLKPRLPEHVWRVIAQSSLCLKGEEIESTVAHLFFFWLFFS